MKEKFLAALFIGICLAGIALVLFLPRSIKDKPIVRIEILK